MSRIVVTTIGSLGDLHPYIALAIELRDRSHEIVFVTVKDYAPKIESLGFEFQPLRPDYTAIDDPQIMAQMMDRYQGTERVFKDFLLANFRESYTALLAAAKDADFIVAHEVVFAAALVAEQLRLRWAVCTLAPGSFFSAYDPFVIPPYPFLAKLPFGVPVNRLVRELAKIATRDWGKPIRQLRRELGLAPIIGNPVIDAKFSPYLVLALFSRAIGAPQPDWPPHTIQTGFTFYDGESERAIAPALQQFLAAGEPPIVFTLGSTAVLTPGEFFQTSVAAAQRLNRRAVLLIGNNPPPVNLSDRIVAFDYAPYSAIFPHAAAIVHQGGIGTTAQALRAGRPTLIMPYSHDQPDNAARVERLGTSRTIAREDYFPDRVAQQLADLLTNDRYATTALAVSQMLQAEDGVKLAGDAIEQQLISPATESTTVGRSRQ